MNRLGMLWAALALASLVSAANAQVLEMYRWTDEEGVVHLTNGLGEIPEQFRSQATRIRSAEARPAPPPSDKAAVQFQRRGDLMVVNAILNGKTALSFVLDTGASYTTISPAAAQQAGIQMPDNPTVLSFHTANGIIQAPLATVRSLQVGGLELKDVTVAVHDVFPDPGIAGLLGLNFLNEFRLDIDSRAGLLNLQKK
jgi:clan AA aspartic protease (TIGR02281 family)